ncbi:MAG: hypothetical protein LUD74_08165 [Tannerellaceae bacterium]|nr:hypothetical protein [Tannerellaceae bacterium]
MSRYGKEIQIGLLVAIITGLAIYYYSAQLHSRRLSANSDWHTYVPDNSYALLHINRPAVITGILFADTVTKNIFRKYLPAPVLGIITNKKLSSPLYASFHTNGELFYTNVNQQQFNKLQKELLNSYFKFYQPETEMINTIQVDFYPVAGNRFFGSFYHQGIWVGSFSRRLLEESIQQITTPSAVNKEMSKRVDRNAPVNLFLVADSISQYISTDSINQQIGWDQWVAADIFISEQSLCFFTQTPKLPANDAVQASYLHAMNTYLFKLTGGYPTEGELSGDGEDTYYSACLPLLLH